ncbi:PTS mannitol transporter subunit IICB [Ignavigranum ruoffiae]|uniref:PTS mannitol transporter subunit IICB n=1 Tax=Ignavigranum ruoffiae TaxID=89093 RepID=UPI0024AD9B01|nr:PTS mannitol transporter subunit IICB [Ignavigranum ruoffiae]
MERQNNVAWKSGIQKLGSYLSSMVMPNIGGFIAWGVLTALVIPDGYLPNEALGSMVGPMQQYLLPLLIGFTGGSIVYQQRGGVVGAIATMGVIAGAGDTPMFIGAMMMGPIGGWFIKKFDQAMDGKIPSGFEMLINNFSSGLLGFFLAVLGFYAIGPVVSGVTNFLAAGVQTIINAGILPLANIFIEPAKILFLNNAINHGILTPIGTQQAESLGKSVIYLLEANPGPGLGVLLAYFIFGKGSAKSSSIGAMIIHFLGGIHEIYFPYVMMKPMLFLAVIAGGVTGTFVFQLLGAALTSPASPGSIIAIMGMSAKGAHLSVLMGVLAAALVSFMVAAMVLKLDRNTEDNLEAMQDQVAAAKRQSKGQVSPVSGDAAPALAKIDRIIFACDAGMGSSAMGASLLRKKAKSMQIDLPITNVAISQLQDQPGTLVITQEELTDRARRQAPQAEHVSVGNFLDGERYDQLLSEMIGKDKSKAPVSEEETVSKMNITSKKVYFVYQDTVGQTTMAASQFRNKQRANGHVASAQAIALDQLTTSNEDVLITNPELKDSLQERFPQATLLIWEDLLDEENYDAIL